MIMKDTAEAGVVRGYQQVYKGSVSTLTTIFVNIPLQPCLVLSTECHIDSSFSRAPFCGAIWRGIIKAASLQWSILTRVHRFNDRVRKRAMTSFERDKTMSNLSSQLDYKVQYIYTVIVWSCDLIQHI